MIKEVFVVPMIHLKALPGSPDNENDIDYIFKNAYQDLKTIEKAGAELALVENFFDTPYDTKVSLETLVSYVAVFTALKKETNISLGVNIHGSSGIEELIVAEICGADFIRVENFGEVRLSTSGITCPIASELIRKKRSLNSSVRIYADVNVKHTVPVVKFPLEELINEIESYVDGIILTGTKTGQKPSVEELKYLRTLTNKKLILGSGINVSNISDYLPYTDGFIIGSSIKEGGVLSNPISAEKLKKLLEVI